MNTEERLEKLERELARAKRFNRWLFAILFLAGGAYLLVTFFAGANATAQEAAAVLKEVRANRFVLVDEKGKNRAALTAFKDGPGLALYDENDRPRAALTALKDGPGLTLYDEKGNTRAELMIGKNGPMLRLFDETGKVRTSMGAGQAASRDGKAPVR